MEGTQTPPVMTTHYRNILLLGFVCWLLCGAALPRSRAQSPNPSSNDSAHLRISSLVMAAAAAALSSQRHTLIEAI